MNKVIYILLWSMLFTIPLAAQKREVTIEQCYELAKKNYPAIHQYKLIEETAAFNLANARRMYLPQVDVYAQGTYQSDVNTLPAPMKQSYEQAGLSVDGLNKDQYQIGLNLRQSIWDGGEIAAKRKVIRAQKEVSIREIDEKMYALRDRINALYFGACMLKQRSDQNAQVYQLLSKHVKRMEAALKNGTATRTQLDQLLADRVANEQQQAEIDTSLRAYLHMLGVFIGKTIGIAELSLPKLTDVVGLQNNRPELHTFQALQALYTSQRKQVFTDLKPKLSIFGNGYYGNPGLDMFESMLDADWTCNYRVGVSIKWNLSALYTHKDRLRILDRKQKQVTVQEDVFRFNTRLQETQEMQEVEKMRQILAKDDELIQLRRRIRETAEKQFKLGVIVASDLLREITAESNAQRQQIEHHVGLLSSIYKLKYTDNAY